MILAILRAQWLSMRSFRLGTSRRGAVFSLLTGLFWYGFWTLVAIVCEEYLARPGFAKSVSTVLPKGFLLVFLYWQFIPIISASMGASLDLRKLLVYPIPARKLFVVELLLRLATSIEMLLVLAGGSVGLMRNPLVGSWTKLPRLSFAILIFIAINALLSAGLRSLLERLLARKRLREILVLLLVLVTAAPRLLMASGVKLKTLERLLSMGEGMLWPWTAASQAILGHATLLALPVLVLWTALAALFGMWQFRRSLRYDMQAAQATESRERKLPAGSGTQRLYRLPSMFLPDPVGAIVEKELRSLVRTPRFRLVFIMGFSFGIMVWLPMTMTTYSSAITDNFLALVSIYALTLLGQVSYWNAFGFDRSAAQVYFSMPMRISQALVGKNVAAAILIFLEIAAVTAACLLLRVRISAGKILEAFLVVAVAALYMLAMGNLSSVHYPRAMSPERVSQGGAGSRFQALVLIFYPLALLPVFLAYAARAVFRSQLIFDLVLGFAAVLGGIVYWIAMESAVEAARKRRETILAELSRTEGPIIQE